MKIIRFLLFCVSLIPLSVNAAPSEFSMAAQLLAAAKNADVQQVQALVNNGANVNFVDSTGLSIVCTALMNNDVRAAQILQMYGADASRCDVQIKRYNSKNKPKSTGGLFGGLSSAQSLTLAAAGAAVVAGGYLEEPSALKSMSNRTAQKGKVPYYGYYQEPREEDFFETNVRIKDKSAVQLPLRDVQRW